MQFQYNLSQKEEDTVIAAEPCSSSKEQSTDVAKNTASIATHEARNTDKNCSSKLNISEIKAKGSSIIAVPSTSVNEDILSFCFNL